MERQFLSIARRLWPELESLAEEPRFYGIGDVLITLLGIPLALVGLVWLALETNLAIIRQQWPFLLLFAGLIFIFGRIKYFFIFEIRADRYGSSEGSLSSMLQWTAAFLYGPSALWLSCIGTVVYYTRILSNLHAKSARWANLRSLGLEVAVNSLGYLAGLSVYRVLGGPFPLQDLSASTLLRAAAAILVHFLATLLVWSGYTLFVAWTQRMLKKSDSVLPVFQFMFVALGTPVLAYPFAILLAGLFTEHGLLIFFFLVAGLVLVAYLARQLSWAAESSRQQSRQLEKLEQLGRAIINSPLDASSLSSLLSAHVPTMFPSGRVAIWLAPENSLVQHPQEWNLSIEPVWSWVRDQGGTHAFLAREPLPWQNPSSDHDPIVTAPIVDVDSGEPIGCVYIELRRMAQPWDTRSLHSLFPAVQNLAAQVASALHQARNYQESLDYQATLKDLEFAGRIQASFLPAEMPRMDGWELAVTLLPARETSGDFFDLIPLEDGRVGIVVADVADKGVGAALYMALSRTLIRTYALQYGAQPDIVLFSANERILEDARANLFVTAFYGVLDPTTGMLTYSNAGHNPPFLFCRQDGGSINALTPTGMPLGIDLDAAWTQATVEIHPGDLLILYTDGIPDTQNSEGGFFKERRMVEVVQEHPGRSAQEIQVAILDEVQDFSEGAAQFDDITLLVLGRYPVASQAGDSVEPVQAQDKPVEIQHPQFE